MMTHFGGDLIIIQVAYMRPNDLEKSIESIIAHTDVPYIHVIIDNSGNGNRDLLEKYQPSRLIFINAHNKGKAAAFNQHGLPILRMNTNKHFISIDGDIVVPKGWAATLIENAKKISMPFGILSPMYADKRGIEEQLTNRHLEIHEAKDLTHHTDNVYYNKRVGGGCILVDRHFFIECGGYDDRYLYGGDDGKLCANANDRGLFVGFTSEVIVQHLRGDEDEGYQKWKKAALKNSEIRQGYWDRAPR